MTKSINNTTKLACSYITNALANAAYVFRVDNMPRGHVKEFTEDQLALARHLRANKASWRQIAEAVGGCGEDTIHAAIDSEYRERRNVQSRTSHRRASAREQRRIAYREIHLVRTNPPPETILEEARRAYAAPRTITADFFGDPRPGRSALDRRNSAC